MADLKSKQIKFPLTGTSVVSSSAQIATDISGSFVTDSGSFSTRITTDSGSFSTRVTTAESELGNTLVSSSAQISTDISGSFVAPSASFSTRVTTTETELENTLISGSAQIATDISGSFVAPSASFSTRVTTAETELENTLISGSAQIADDISGSLSTAAVVGLGANLVSASAQVDHDSTTNFVANEHINHTSVSITAGDGLTGGGDISSTRTLAVGAGTGVTVNSNDVAIGQAVGTTSNVQFANITGSNISGSGTGSFGNLEVGGGGGITLDSVTTSGTGSFAGIKLQHEGHISGSLGTIKGIETLVVTSGSLDYIDVEGDVTASKLYGTIGTATQGTIDHDSLSGFVADEHVAHGDVTITAGAGLTGGGTIASTRTLAVGAGTGVTVNANDVAIGQAVATDSNVLFANITGSNISGSASGSLQNLSVTDNISATNISASVVQATQGTIDIHSLSGYVANENIDHSSVSITAGAGLTGGGTIASTRDIAVGAGTGVTVNANDVAIGQAVATDSDVEFATITTTGNITAQGDIIAENYIVSSSVTHMTSSAISGSSIFGDTQDDTHQFTGSMLVSGSTYNIDSIGSVSSSASGSFLNIDVTDNLTVERLKAGSADIDGGITIDNITIDGTEIDLSSGDLTLDVEGDIILDANGADIKLKDNGTEFGRFSRVSSDLVIKSITGDKDIVFKGVDDSSTITALTLDMSDAGKAIFESSISSSASGSFLNVDVADNLGVSGKFTLPNITDVSASIASAVAGGDDMGNHTATQDLDMDGNDIFDVGHISGSGNISGSLGNILGYKSGSFNYLNTDGDISASGNVSANNVAGTITTATQGTIDHDSLANFVANEHVDHSAVSVVAGAGLTGGGTIAASRTINVVGGTGVTANANDIAIGQDVATTANVKFNHITGSGNISGSAAGDILGFASASFLNVDAPHIKATNVHGTILTATQATIDHDSLANFVANEHIDHSSVSVTAGAGLTGGGTIASNRTINVVGGDGITANTNDIAITAAQTTIESIYKADLVIGEDDETQIDFETVNEIHFDVDNSELLNLAGSKISGSQASTGSFGSLVTDANVGIGESNPSVPLEIIGDVSASASGSFLNVDVDKNVNATNLYGTVLTATQGTIDHDSLANFVANEHVDHSSVSVTAGDGLTGGGTIAANRTINVVGGDGITANANDVAITAAQTTITSILAADLKIGEDDQTKIDFETENNIHFYAGNQHQVTVDNGAFSPNTDSDVDLGKTAKKFKVAFVDSGSFDYMNVTGFVTASTIETSGDIVAFGSSDRNLKDNIQPIENPLEKMDKIGGYTFVWNDNQSIYKGKDIGVVAQEIQEVLPEIVATRDNGYLGVKYEKIVPLLIESIKELKKEVEDIKKNCDCLNK